MKAIIINGPMGAGKTAVGRCIAEKHAGTAFIDGDWCMDLHPFAGNDETKAMAVDNILHMTGNYQKSSCCSMVVLSWLMDDGWVRERIEDGMRAMGLDIVSVTLVCSRDELVRRWKNDALCPWRTDEWLSVSLKSLPDFSAMDNCIVTDGLSVDRVADMICALPSRPAVAGHPVIETERLILRPFAESDASDIYEYLKEPLVNCFACMKLRSMEEAVADARRKAANAGYCMAIVLKETGKVIGEIEAHPETSQPDGAESMAMDTFSPCWMLSRDYHGKGYAYEAAHAFLDYLFREKGARRVYAYTEDYNLSCQRLCQKLGMRREGMFMEFVSFVNNPDGTPLYENTLQYAILKKDW